MGLTFLSGLPTEARKRRVLVVIQAWLDDSGGVDQVVQAIAGFMGPTESWAAFSDKWQACLDTSPKIQFFKMDHADGRDGQFYGFSDKQRDDKLRELVSIINEFSFTAIYSVVEIEGFADTFGTYEGSSIFRKPYFYAFHNLVHSIAMELMEQGQKERCEIFFDEHKILGEKAKKWYPVSRILVPEADGRDLLPVEPFFKDDQDFRALQAADFLAWFVRREKGGMPHRFGWLQPLLTKTKLSPNSYVLRRSSMEGITERFNRVKNDPRFQDFKKRISEIATLLADASASDASSSESLT